MFAISSKRTGIPAAPRPLRRNRRPEIILLSRSRRDADHSPAASEYQSMKQKTCKLLDYFRNRGQVSYRRQRPRALRSHVQSFPTRPAAQVRRARRGSLLAKGGGRAKDHGVAQRRRLNSRNRGARGSDRAPHPATRPGDPCPPRAEHAGPIHRAAGEPAQRGAARRLYRDGRPKISGRWTASSRSCANSTAITASPRRISSTRRRRASQRRSRRLRFRSGKRRVSRKLCSDIGQPPAPPQTRRGAEGNGAASPCMSVRGSSLTFGRAQFVLG